MVKTKRAKKEPPRPKRIERPRHIRVRKVAVRGQNVATAAYEDEPVLVLYDIENSSVTEDMARTLGWQMRAFLDEHGYKGSCRIHAIAGSKQLLPENLISLVKESSIKFRHAISKKSQTGDNKLILLLNKTIDEDVKWKRKPGTIVMIASDKGYEKEMNLARLQGYNVLLVYDPALFKISHPYFRCGSSACPFDEFVSKGMELA